MGSINVEHDGSGNAITLSSDGTSLLLNGTAVGGGAGPTFKTFGNSSIMIGDDATGTINNANYNTGLGVDIFAALALGDDNTAVGRRSLNSIVNQSYNTAIGSDTLVSNVESDNTALGYQSLYGNTTGSKNTALGQEALRNNTTGFNLVAAGYRTLKFNTTGSNNVAVGREALYSNTTASSNTAVGHQAGYSNTTGGQNTLIGWKTGHSLTTGLSNTFVGCPGPNNNCGSLITTGSDNTIIGAFDGNQGGLDIRTSDNNIVLSDGDGNPRIYVDGSGTVYFGNHDTVASSGYIDKQTSNLYEFKIHASSSTSTNRAITFHNRSNTEAMRIDTSGNLLVGKSVDTLATSGTVLFANGQVDASVDGNYVAKFNRKTSDGTIIELRKNTTGIVGSIGTVSNTVGIHGAGSGDDAVGLVFVESGSSQRIIPCQESFTANNGIVNLGWSTNRFKDLYLSGGVYLGGTGSANKLDDYEEGTWTPVVNYGTYGYSHRRGHYIKIGKMVYIHVGFKINTASSVTGASASISGLPFTSENYGGYQEPHARVAVAGLCVTANLSSNLSFYVSNNGTDLNARSSANNTDAAVPSNTLWQNGTFIKLMIIYTTNS